MGWRALRISPTDRERVLAALFAAGAEAVQESGTAYVTHFRSTTEASWAVEAVRRADPDAIIEQTDTPDVDFSAWRASVRAWDVGRLTVAPPWLAEGCDPATTVIIDPAMAFGTGEHATTRGMLRLLQRVLRRGDVVADLGAGSAVLSIAAAKIGAARVAAVEHDADASANAERNVAANGVGGIVRVITGDAATILPLVAPVRLTLANIASLALLELLPAIRDAATPDGAAVLGGILRSEREGFLRRLGRWTITHEDLEDDWWTIAIEPR